MRRRWVDRESDGWRRERDEREKVIPAGFHSVACFFIVFAKTAVKWSPVKEALDCSLVVP